MQFSLGLIVQASGIKSGREAGPEHIKSWSFDVNLLLSHHTLSYVSAGAPLLRSRGHLCPAPILPVPSAADDRVLQGRSPTKGWLGYG